MVTTPAPTVRPPSRMAKRSPSSIAIGVIRSPHKYKDSREHFQMLTHKRLIDIVDATSKTVQELQRLNLSAGVDIEIKL